MEIQLLIESKYFLMLASASVGVLMTLLTNSILNRRGTFSYQVEHIRLGMTAADQVFGNVSVTWNNQQLPNLYLSRVELRNESMNDYEEVPIRVYTDNTNLLTEQTHVLESPNVLDWSDAYKNQLQQDQDGQLSNNQYAIYHGQREYVIPVMNRGQVVSLTYLNSSKTVEQPQIWLSVSKRGVRVKFRAPQNLIFGVPQARAVFIGVFTGILFTILLTLFVENIWFVVFACFFLGLTVQVPGSFLIKAFRKLQEVISG